MIALVVNPRAQAGRTGRRLDELARLARIHLGDGAVVRPTEGPADGIRQARLAAEEGAELVVAVGGDGTANEVVEGVLTSGARPDVALLPSGTGSDLAKTLGMPTGWDAALAAIASSDPWPVDAMRGTFTTGDGGPAVRHGINVVGMGMAGDVVRRVNEGSKRLGGRASFLVATLGAVAAWRPPTVRVHWGRGDGEPGSWEGPILNVFANNGRFCGGGMCTGPRARMDDGLLDVVIVPDLAWHRLPRLTAGLYDHTLPDLPDTVAFQATWVSAEVIDGAVAPCDIDGEQPGQMPARIDLLSNALCIRAPGLATP